MKLRWVTAILIIVAAAFAFSGAFVPGVAQDQTDQRVSDLETRVAALEAEVFGSPVASPISAGAGFENLSATPGATEPVASSGTTITDSTVEFRGDRSAVSDDFTLEAGTYRVRIEVPAITETENISISLQVAPGSSGVGAAGLYNDYQPKGGGGEFLVTIYTGGEFVIVANGDRPYVVVLEL